MKQLERIQMQKSLSEIAADEGNKADQQFYGELAFNEWLHNKGLPKSPTGPDEPSPKESAQKLKAPTKESTFKANSFQRAQGPSPIREESPATSSSQKSRRVQEASKDYLRQPSPFTDDTDGLYERVSKTTSESPGPQASKEEKMEYFQTKAWNSSTKLPLKDYLPNLEDKYPHDEYTMKPKSPPRRTAHRPQLNIEDVAKAHKMRVPKLSADVIAKKVKPEEYERPVVYKCKHIDDTTKKHIPDLEERPRQEAAIHLANDISSVLFKNALTVDLYPGTPSTTISKLSSSSSSRVSSGIDLPQVTKLVERMARKNPVTFPNIKGEEYDINFGQVAAI